MKIKAIIHSAEEGGFWAEVPSLPGCRTQGETVEEIEENLKEAIALWLEAGESEALGSEKDQIIEVAVCNKSRERNLRRHWKEKDGRSLGSGVATMFT